MLQSVESVENVLLKLTLVVGDQLRHFAILSHKFVGKSFEEITQLVALIARHNENHLLWILNLGGVE